MNISWLYNEPFDFEYKSYVFMAFYQKAVKSFKEYRLYPIKRETDKVFSETKELKYLLQKVDDESTNATAVVKDLLALSEPKLMELKEISTEMELFISENIAIEPYGLKGFYLNEGFLFVDRNSKNYVLEYKINPVYRNEPLLDNVKLQFIETTTNSLKNYYNNFLKRFAKGNYIPATFRVEIPQNFPFYQSVLPVMKQKLFKTLKE